jgi:hypothetical protein
MGHIPLVEEQIRDGRQLIEKLTQDGFPVTAAGWLRKSEDGQWFLYLASPVEDEEGPIGAYRRAYPVVQQMPRPFWIEPLDVKVVGTKDPIANAIAETRQRYPGNVPVRYGEVRLGKLSVEGAYLYPPTVKDTGE